MTTPLTTYAAVPWYRRAATLTWFTLVGLFLIPPLLWAACIICLTGSVYYNRVKKDGTLARWSAGNKVAAVIIMVLQGLVVANKFGAFGNVSKAQEPAAAKAPQSVWDPDPSRAGQLTQTVMLDRYQLSLPKEFTAEKIDAAPPKGTKLVIWSRTANDDRPPALLIATIMSGKAEVAEAKKNLRQALVTFSGGMTDSSGIKIAKRGVTETGSLGGMAFSRFKWTGATANQAPVNGMAYGAIDDAQAVLILPITFDANPEADMRLMEAVVATLKKP